MKRAILLLTTLVGAMLLACTGVVLAQQNATPPAEKTTPDQEQRSMAPGSDDVQRGPEGKPIPDQYIVVFKDEVPDPREEAREHARRHGAEVLHVYKHALKGYAARLSAERVEQVKQESNVLFVSQDREVEALKRPRPPTDTTAPETTIDSGPEEGSTQNSDTASFTFSSSEGNSTFECRRDGSAWGSCQSPKEYTGLSEGSHTFEVRAKDAAGNVDQSPASRTWVARYQKADTGVRRIDGSSDGTHQTLTNKGADVNVAVIDTGIDLTHPDLTDVNNPRDGTDCVTPGTSASDDNGHGTHVAGAIAARENDTGVVGVAPKATLFAVKVLNSSGSGTWSQVICGIDYVTGTHTADADPSNDISVANMSLGGGGSDDGDCGNSNSDALHRAICKSVDAGVTYVVAAGNSAADAKNSVPAAYDEVVTVSALADFNGQSGGGANATCRSDVDDTFADFSNYGQDVDIGAPGVCIKSTWKGGGYNTISGTSMASPHVAGAATLYIHSNPGARPADVKSALIAAQESGPISGDPDSFKEGVVKVSAL